MSITVGVVGCGNIAQFHFSGLEKAGARVKWVSDLDEQRARPYAERFGARPSYEYFEGAEPILRGYCEEVDGLVKELGLSPGPDFFAAYASERRRWYGDDPVHPNVEGVRRMAELWHEALVRVMPGGC